MTRLTENSASKKRQRGHIEADYGDLTPTAKMLIGSAICAVGMAFIVISAGWLAALGVAVALWGYRLQMEGLDEKEQP
jgi:hypothetical protein